MQQTLVIMECDLCGSKEGAETVPIGPHHEVDLCPKHQEELDKAIEPYFRVARRALATRAAAPAKRPKTTGAKPQPTQTEIRLWARSQGYQVSDMGRLPNVIVGHYKRAHA